MLIKLVTSWKKKFLVDELTLSGQFYSFAWDDIKQMRIEAWGEPSSINKTTGSWGTHEQWVYGSGNYLYFEGNKLTAIQN